MKPLNYNAFFTLSGVVSYQPKVFITKQNKQFVTFFVVQKRTAGANNKEYTRKFIVTAFDEVVVRAIKDMGTKHHIEISGTIGFRNDKYVGRYVLTLTATRVEITNATSEEFDELKNSSSKIEQDEEVTATVSLDDVPKLQSVADDDLPF
jgi:membrane carboxypeptidase/penicillin-binding protein